MQRELTPLSTGNTEGAEDSIQAEDNIQTKDHSQAIKGHRNLQHKKVTTRTEQKQAKDHPQPKCDRHTHTHPAHSAKQQTGANTYFCIRALMSLCSWESSNSPAGPSALAPPSRGKLFNRDLPGLGGGGGGSFFPVLLEEASSDFLDEEADSGRSKGALGAPGVKPLPLGEPSPALTAGGAELPLLLAPPTGLLAPLGGSLLWLRYLEMSDWSLSPLSEPAFSGSVQIIVNVKDFSSPFFFFF